MEFLRPPEEMPGAPDCRERLLEPRGAAGGSIERNGCCDLFSCAAAELRGSRGTSLSFIDVPFTVGDVVVDEDSIMAPFRKGVAGRGASALLTG